MIRHQPQQPEAQQPMSAEAAPIEAGICGLLESLSLESRSHAGVTKSGLLVDLHHQLGFLDLNNLSTGSLVVVGVCCSKFFGL